MRLHFTTKTVYGLPLSRMSRMEMDYNLKKLANVFKFSLWTDRAYGLESTSDGPFSKNLSKIFFSCSKKYYNPQVKIKGNCICEVLTRKQQHNPVNFLWVPAGVRSLIESFTTEINLLWIFDVWLKHIFEMVSVFLTWIVAIISHSLGENQRQG